MPRSSQIKCDTAAADAVLEDLKRKSSGEWKKIAEENALGVFHRAARDVPAYKDFLKKNNLDSASIITYADLQKVPIMNKQNYLRRYELKDLYWNGTLGAPLIFTSTSGSTGQPFYFSRQESLDWQYSMMHELFFNNSDTRKSTLVIVGFGMGVWIGGTITFEAYELLGRRRNYPISVLPTGINKKEIFNALAKLAPNFEQTILIGYAPFMKDVVDEAPQHGIDLAKLNIRMTFAAEAFTENFRDYLAKAVGMKNPCLDTMNIYGTADIGAVAFETPLSILIRRLAVKTPALFKDIFSDIQKTPTLAQYFPQFMNIEYVDDQILLTGENSAPLVRYSIGDRGGVYSYDELRAKIEQHGIDLDKEAKDAGVAGTESRLPFVFVYERSDLSTTLYGLQIYPETIREILIQPPFDGLFTGKFTLMTKFDEKHDQYLEINLEQRTAAPADAAVQSELVSKIVDNLIAKNSEYRELNKFIKERSHPKLALWPHEDPLYFRPGVKQAWVKK